MKLSPEARAELERIEKRRATTGKRRVRKIPRVAVLAKLKQIKDPLP